jgi:hypothetical protein
MADRRDQAMAVPLEIPSETAIARTKVPACGTL